MSQLIIYLNTRHHEYRHIIYCSWIVRNAHVHIHTLMHIHIHNNIYKMLYIQYQGHLDLVLTNQKQLIVVFITCLQINDKPFVMNRILSYIIILCIYTYLLTIQTMHIYRRRRCDRFFFKIFLHFTRQHIS